MIFLKLKLDNIYMFKDVEFDFTYNKKVKNPIISGEFLQDFPNINYKKVNIFMGANASGKTTIGKIMCNLQNFMSGKDLGLETKNAIFDKNKNAKISVIYALPLEKTLNKLDISFNCDGVVFEEYKEIKLLKSKSLFGNHKNKTNLIQDLDKSKAVFSYDIKNNHGITNIGFKSVSYALGNKISGNTVNWYYLFTEINNNSNINTTIDKNLFEKIIKSFDSSITSAVKVNESDENKYIVKFLNGDELDINFDNFNLNNESYNRLSSGTRQSIEIAGFIYRIITSQNGIGTFFLDEKMSYSHSELEQSIINLIINKLGEDTQFFYTTHNYDILDMNLPSHSYTFFTNDKFSKIINPEKLGYTKNDRSLLSLVKNDVFNNIPDTEHIEELLYE